MIFYKVISKENKPVIAREYGCFNMDDWNVRKDGWGPFTAFKSLHDAQEFCEPSEEKIYKIEGVENESGDRLYSVKDKTEMPQSQVKYIWNGYGIVFLDSFLFLEEINRA